MMSLDEELKSFGFKTLQTDMVVYRGKCPYCGEHYRGGQGTAWSNGIAKGHDVCIRAAYQDCTLILSPIAPLHRSGSHLAHCRSAEDSWKALQAVGATGGPIERLADQRLERECFGQYNLVAARCDGCDSRLRCRHYTAESSVLASASGRWARAQHTFEELRKIAVEKNISVMTAAQARAYVAGTPMKDCFGKHMLYGESCRNCGYRQACEKETRVRHTDEPFNEWRKPHCSPSSGLQCNGDPGQNDVCSEPGCHYAGHNSPDEPKERETIITKPGAVDGIPSCEHFPPERIAVLVMHERSRPGHRMALEMEKKEYLALVEKQWEDMAAKALADWKRKQKGDLPICPVHKFLTTHMRKMRDRAFLRELYLVCPGKETGGF